MCLPIEGFSDDMTFNMHDPLKTLSHHDHDHDVILRDKHLPGKRTWLKWILRIFGCILAYPVKMSP